jgi:hypothetical protein
MEHQAIDVNAQAEAVARYLGDMFPTLCIDRYRDSARGIVGFRFIGAAHGNIEFSDGFLATLAASPGVIAHELHLRQAGAEINATEPGQRIIFFAEEVRREPITT